METIIKKYRVDGFYEGVEFYFKIYTRNDDQKEAQLMTLCVDKNGLFYYRRKSHILTKNENQEKRESYNGRLAMKQIGILFESLQKIGWSDASDQEVKIRVEKKKIIIEIDE